MKSSTLDVRNSKHIDVFDVAQPESSTALVGAPGVSVVTSDSTPTFELIVPGMIVDEFLALCLDEGQNSSNAWRLHEHVQHGLDRLVRSVEGVLIRAKVIEPELAEVGHA